MTTATKPRPAPVLTPVERDDYIATARMTFDEWIDWDYEGGFTEWVDGEVRVYDTVTFPHSILVGFVRTVVNLFAEVVGDGIVASGPYSLRLGDGRGRQPDVFYFAPGRRERVGQRFADGPADLIVEVLSDDSVTRDNREQFREYEAAGVREYWVIDSRPGRRIARFYILDDGRYTEVLPDELGIYRSTVLERFWLDVAWLWEEQPKALAAWNEIAATLTGQPPAQS